MAAMKLCVHQFYLFTFSERPALVNTLAGRAEGRVVSSCCATIQRIPTMFVRITAAGSGFDNLVAFS
jgi:hypothetical protein